jgi:hypothetical protein
MSIEVAKDREGCTFCIARGDPALQRGNLLAQFSACVVRRTGQALVEAAGLQMDCQQTQ